MLKNLKNKLRKNLEIFGLILLIIITGISTSIFNYKKNKSTRTKCPTLRLWRYFSGDTVFQYILWRARNEMHE